MFFAPHDYFPPDTSPAYESPLPSADICFSCIMPSDSALDLFCHLHCHRSAVNDGTYMERA